MVKKNLLAKIARMYYLEEVNQKEIAQRLSMSMASVSRAVARAKQEGIVEIHVHDSAETDSELEASIEREYGVRECSVVRAHYADEDGATDSLAASLSDIISRVVLPGGVVGVSWGETLRAVSDRMTPKDHGAHVVPIIGAMGTVETGIYPNAIAKSFAAKFGGHAYLVNTPAVFDNSETRISVQNERAFESIAALWASVDTAVVSVSGVTRQDSIYRFGIFTSEELHSLQSSGVRSAVNFDFLDCEGNHVVTEIDDRMIKLGMTRLREMRNLIVVASGTRKIPAIRAALRSGFVNVLVTDKQTAAGIVNLEGKTA